MERRTKVQMPDGTTVEGVDIPVVESTERWTEVTLEDGSVLRLKASIMAAVRIPGHFDNEGNPTYSLKSNVQMMVVNAPENLKRG